MLLILIKYCLDNGIHFSELSDFNGGVRLRCEIRREFAPTQVFEWAGKFGSAADYMRTTGEVPQGTRFVSGVRFWF